LSAAPLRLSLTTLFPNSFGMLPELDTKLNRDVAIKVLPEAFANDPARMARFEREAKALASLNHPHIAQIYGIEARERSAC